MQDVLGMQNYIERDVVLIRNAKKSYGSGKAKHQVLKGIDITVKEGSM